PAAPPVRRAEASIFPRWYLGSVFDRWAWEPKAYSSKLTLTLQIAWNCDFGFVLGGRGVFERKGPPVEAALLVERDQPGAKLPECDLRNGAGVGYTTCSDLDDL